ncbi:MAG: phosphate acetyltransferase [Bacteroidetes bacterium]|nr:phosphate acetyltransferase [Bacteroidota bacterium]
MNPATFIDDLKAKAVELNKHIVYPDATDERALKAARIVTDEGLARITLVGSEPVIRETADANDVDLDGIDIADPTRLTEMANEFGALYHDLRKHKGMTETEAADAVQLPLFFGNFMVRTGMADGSVAGSLSTTGDVIKAGLHCIGLKEGIKTVSSLFIMKFADKVWAFADCAVMPLPDAAQLADITISTADNYRALTDEEALVAMLSFSTRGSAKHELIDKIVETMKLVRERRPDLKVDGEMQFDAAIIPAIGKKKAPDSEIAGQANVFIFPDLQSGNIAYKITERLGGAEALGPIVQGLARPAYDLSRGCSVNDIVVTTVFNAVMGAV